MNPRNLYKVAIAYATVEWLVMQIGNYWLIKGVFVRRV